MMSPSCRIGWPRDGSPCAFLRFEPGEQSGSVCCVQKARVRCKLLLCVLLLPALWPIANQIAYSHPVILLQLPRPRRILMFPPDT